MHTYNYHSSKKIQILTTVPMFATNCEALSITSLMPTLSKEEEGSMEGSSSTSLHFLDLCNLRLGETTPYIGY